MSGITSSQSDFLLASPQLTISPGHFTLIFPAAAGKLTTERPGPRFRRQFLPISRKWSELEAVHSRPCWRRPPCEALFLRRVTPTCSGFSRAVAGRVGAFLSAKPYFFAESRQHGPDFPGFPAPVLAPSSLRSLISSPRHANMLRVFPGASPDMLAPSFLRILISSPHHANNHPVFPARRRPCWRRPPCETLFLRQATPTCSGFSRIAGGFVGAVLSAKPYFFAGSRQHVPHFPSFCFSYSAST